MNACVQRVVDARPADLVAEARRLRDSAALGKPGPLLRLFDFLLARSSGVSPKEIEIAVAVFDKKLDFDVAQDALVRVYVHKLRRRLDEHYLRNPGDARIVVPKGEYRLVLEQTERAAVAPAPAASVPERATRRPQILAFVLGIVVAVVATAFLRIETARSDAATTASASPIWSSLLADDLPVTIVVGDYYLLGEVDRSGEVKRLVREFDINSEADFIDYLELNPGSAQQYRNLRLTYLPTGTAVALSDLSALLAGRKPVHIKLMSELDGETLRTSHVVYIGYLSGLGMLGDIVFGASRLRVQGTYDELVDSATSRSYVAHIPSTTEHAFVDYGYFATLRGPVGNRIIVVAGTRDAGVMQSADAATDAGSLAQLLSQAGKADTFESLTEVQGVDRAKLSTRPIFVAPL